MSDAINNYVLDALQELTVISEKDGCKISVVKDTFDGALFVKKHFDANSDIGIYKSLMGAEHSGLPKIYHVIESGNGFVVVEEYISGSTLKSVMESRSFSVPNVADIAIQLCDALIKLHSMTPPIIHRDINPSNIMLMADGKVKLIDFDAAKEYKTSTTDDTTTLGTKAYAAPEQFGYAKTDARTDIYCLGATMYHLLTGEPYSKGSAHPTGKIGKIIHKCLQIDPANRYSDADALRKDLLKLKRPAIQFRTKVVAAGVLCIFVATLALFLLLPNSENLPVSSDLLSGEFSLKAQHEDEQGLDHDPSYDDAPVSTPAPSYNDEPTPTPTPTTEPEQNREPIPTIGTPPPMLPAGARERVYHDLLVTFDENMRDVVLDNDFLYLYFPGADNSMIMIARIEEMVADNLNALTADLLFQGMTGALTSHFDETNRSPMQEVDFQGQTSFKSELSMTGGSATFAGLDMDGFIVVFSANQSVYGFVFVEPKINNNRFYDDAMAILNGIWIMPDTLQGIVFGNLFISVSNVVDYVIERDTLYLYFADTDQSTYIMIHVVDGESSYNFGEAMAKNWMDFNFNVLMSFFEEGQQGTLQNILVNGQSAYLSHFSMTNGRGGAWDGLETMDAFLAIFPANQFVYSFYFEALTNYYHLFFAEALTILENIRIRP